MGQFFCCRIWLDSAEAFQTFDKDEQEVVKEIGEIRALLDEEDDEEVQL